MNLQKHPHKGFRQSGTAVFFKRWPEIDDLYSFSCFLCNRRTIGVDKRAAEWTVMIFGDNEVLK
ncbi:Uncharacterised protein [Mycobacteroides abscessus subsp. abscessus]|nr:Uncharacterised protein [Mycobacteroides abscessus subsp. abscessus]